MHMSRTASVVRFSHVMGLHARAGAHAAAQASWALACKRALDILGATVLLVVAALPLLVAAAAVALTSRGPVIFGQTRIGVGGRRFRMYKLRTMVAGADEDQQRLARANEGTFLKIARDPRVTRLGRVLRKGSIDELPQLFNVLKGDMSLVGPRPLLVCDFEKFPCDERMRRFAMLPGLTGLWQVSGRSLLSDDERMRLDLDYVDRWSLRLDLAILLRTVPAVITCHGAT